ncbi:MAG TPA: YihY/virulence factor BrkB family protein [Gemmatimonadaceae bacterium]|jgi:membrane protein|nr:YihY/virulence factor BrkB family protein [Gemmatimonadaceae bacterium]
MVLFGYRVESVVKKTLREILDDRILGLAAQTAYYFFFSLFPMLLFLAPLLSLAGNKEETFNAIVGRLQEVVPSEGWALIGGVIEDVVYAKNAPGLMSVGALLAIWAGSNVFSSLIDALNIAYDVEDTRPWWKKKLIAVASVIATGLVILTCTVLILGGGTLTDWIADRLALGGAARAVWGALQLPIAFVLLVTIAALSYYFLPNIRQNKRQVVVGAIFTTVAWALVTLGFRAYVANFADYNATYGALGGVIVLLTWMYFSMLVFLIGGEINAELHRGTGAVAPRVGVLYGGRIETAAAAGVPSLDRVERLEPLGARRT